MRRKVKGLIEGRKATGGMCVFTSVTEEDNHWVGQYLNEMERLNLNFAVHFDRCHPVTKCKMSNHPLCVGVTNQDNDRIEFAETHKQAVFDLVWRSNLFSFALSLDIDETFEASASGKLGTITRTKARTVSLPQVTLWGGADTIRVDEPFRTQHRTRGYNLRAGVRFIFNSPVVNGASVVSPRRVSPLYQMSESARIDLHVLHHGLMTRESRRQHLERWDKIYSKAVGYNPYNFWRHICDEEAHPPTLEPNPYL